MRRLATGLVLLVLVLPATASAALPFNWWTQAKANRAVIAKNFQLWNHEGSSPHSTITKSACKGYGLAKRRNGVRYFRHFLCATTWKYDTADPNYGSGPFRSPLLCDTTKAKPLGLRCRISA